MVYLILELFFERKVEIMTINNRFVEPPQTAHANVRVVRADKMECVSASELIKEHFMEISINEQPAFRLMCTPNRLAELALGRIVTEGLIRECDDVESVFICETGKAAKVYLKEGIALLEGDGGLYTEPTCCTQNKLLGSFRGVKDLEPLPRAAYSEEHIFALAEKFHENASLHRRTSGTHGCYLSYRGRYQGVFEDIGRHNALDKAVGYALINGLSFQDCILFTTGRVPVDMVEKAVTAGIPVLVSKSVSTVDAAELAKRCNLTLICRAWRDSYEVYNEADGERTD